MVPIISKKLFLNLIVLIVFIALIEKYEKIVFLIRYHIRKIPGGGCSAKQKFQDNMKVVFKLCYMPSSTYFYIYAF